MGSIQRRKNTTGKLVYAALCVSFCVVLPQAFHMIPNFGSVFCPIHIPVLLCGLVCGWQYGLACGLLGPLLSALCVGMPTMAELPVMMIECAVYGLLAGAIFRMIHMKSIYLNLYASLLLAMVGGRIAAGTMLALFFARGMTTFPIWISAYFITSFPGIVTQLLLIPTAVYTLMKAHLVPSNDKG